MSATNKTEKKTVQEKIAELDALMAWFDSDEFELEAAIERFSEAEKLAKDIEHDLESLKNIITKIKHDFSK